MLIAILNQSTLVSNFATPAWFDPLSDRATVQYDKPGKLHAPLSILKGGYVSKRMRKADV